MIRHLLLTNKHSGARERREQSGARNEQALRVNEQADERMGRYSMRLFLSLFYSRSGGGGGGGGGGGIGGGVCGGVGGGHHLEQNGKEAVKRGSQTMFFTSSRL